MLFQLCLGRLRVLNMFRFTLVRYISSLPTTSRERNRVRILDVTNGAPITVFCMIRCSILIGRICQIFTRFGQNLVRTSEVAGILFRRQKSRNFFVPNFCAEVRKAENEDGKRKWVWYNKNILKKLVYRNWKYICLPHLGGDREGSGWAKDWSASCAAGCATSCKAPKFELTME